MIEVNLIPDVKLELLRAQRMRAIVITISIFASIIAAAIVVLLLIYIFAFQGVRSASLDDDIKKGKEALMAIEDTSGVLTIQKQLSSITELNDQKYLSSRLFGLISAISPAEPNTVAFSQINLSTTNPAEGDEASFNGQIFLEGQTNSYDSLEVFKKTIEYTRIEYYPAQEPVAEGEEAPEVEPVIMPVADAINIAEVSYGEDTDGNKVLRFSMSFKFPVELLNPTSENLRFRVVVNGIVTDSYLGIPRFTERADDLEEEME